MRLRATLTIATVGAVLLAGAAVGGFALHSPDERITASLPPTVLTATVERTTLTTQLTGTGTFEPVGSVRVRTTAPAGMAAVISATPRAVGDPLPWCTPLVEVSGRPVLVLHGDLPAWRDLTVGDVGPDVRQLQAALRECGREVNVDGAFGEYTAKAVTALYASTGYPAITSVDEGLGGGSRPSAADDATAATSTTASASAVVIQVSTTLTTITDAAAGSDEPTPGTPPEDPAPATGTPEPPAPTVIAPRGELLFLPTAGRLTTIGARGTVLEDDPVATISLAGDQFAFALSAAQRTQLAEGMTITVTRDDWTADLALPPLPETAVTDASGLPAYPVSIPLNEPVPGSFYGQPGQFTITIGSPDPYDCVVPVSAIYQDMSGQVYVLRADGDAPMAGGTPPPTTRVDVEVIASAGGYSALRPQAEGALDTGDEVVIGER